MMGGFVGVPTSLIQKVTAPGCHEKEKLVCLLCQPADTAVPAIPRGAAGGGSAVLVNEAAAIRGATH